MYVDGYSDIKLQCADVFRLRNLPFRSSFNLFWARVICCVLFFHLLPFIGEWSSV